ncbi:hypothetical protein MWN41_09520 [Ornithobacterium rhinotracheale]|uniref:hypothetical protein n=1 Tax=Ornithobacterium rhinotracheale TaxID=28251 RepID=UPI001FF5424D|nr:hypothetical protein [Ornithobacterium rhinotracheale]MCK0203250.1 hypothetical protein [Ornithobacterium rhinotracheale]
MSANLEAIKKKIRQVNNKNFVNIAAYDLSFEDWKHLIFYLNNTYKITFKEYVSNYETQKIDYESLLDFWNGNTEKGYMAIIDVDSILVNCYFNGVSDLDFDIIYDDLLRDKNINKIIDFISSMSNTIDKPFYLEEDNYDEKNKLIEIYKNKVW